MASAYAKFWQTLLAAQSQLSAPLAGTNSLLRATWRDVKTVEASPGKGKKITILIPANVDAEVVDTPYADMTFNEYNLVDVSIDFDKKPQHGTVIRSFEQFNSPAEIKDVLLQPMINGVMAKANKYVAAKLNGSAGNFTANTAIATTGSAVTPTQFLAGQQALIEQRVNVQDPANMTYVQAPAVWTKQLGNADWTAESQVGINQAQDAKRDGALKVAFGAAMAYDQDCPATGTSPNKTFTSVYMSRTAIATAFRPLPKGGPGTETTYTYVDGVPLRIMLSFDHEKDGWLLSVDTGMGLAVVRPEQGVLFSTAQS